VKRVIPDVSLISISGEYRIVNVTDPKVHSEKAKEKDHVGLVKPSMSWLSDIKELERGL